MQESQVIHTPDSTGAGIRTIPVTTLINGVPTVVQMQVIAIGDDAGNVVRDFATVNMQVAILQELRAIRQLLAAQHGIFDLAPEGPFAVPQAPSIG